MHRAWNLLDSKEELFASPYVLLNVSLIYYYSILSLSNCSQVTYRCTLLFSMYINKLKLTYLFQLILNSFPPS